jgi:hypothetical protein
MITNTKMNNMKTNLTILALFVALMAKSQMTINSVTPNRLCPGDSITYHYTWDGTPGNYQFNMAGQNHNHIWHINSSNFQNGKITFKTPFWWNGGDALCSVIGWSDTRKVNFCEVVGINESELSNKVTYKKVYGNIYLSSTGKKVIFVEP